MQPAEPADFDAAAVQLRSDPGRHVERGGACPGHRPGRWFGGRDRCSHLVGHLVATPAHRRADPCEDLASAEIAHGIDRSADDTCQQALATRMRHSDDAGSRIGQQHRHAVGDQHGQCDPLVCVTSASTSEGPAGQGPSTIATSPPCTWFMKTIRSARRPSCAASRRRFSSTAAWSSPTCRAEVQLGVGRGAHSADPVGQCEPRTTPDPRRSQNIRRGCRSPTSRSRGRRGRRRTRGRCAAARERRQRRTRLLAVVRAAPPAAAPSHPRRAGFLDSDRC